MADVVSEEMRLLITARQWLKLLVDQFDLDPETATMEAEPMSITTVDCYGYADAGRNACPDRRQDRDSRRKRRQHPG